MLAWIIQISIISILFIFLVHHLFTFLKTTLTVPKIKDLVNSPNQKYQHIFNTISHNTDIDIETDIESINNPNSYTSIDLLPSENNMKNELKTFLKKQLNSNSDNNNDNIMGLNMSSSGAFANF